MNNWSCGKLILSASCTADQLSFNTGSDGHILCCGAISSCQLESLGRGRTDPFSNMFLLWPWILTCDLDLRTRPS